MARGWPVEKRRAELRARAGYGAVSEAARVLEEDKRFVSKVLAGKGDTYAEARVRWAERQLAAMCGVTAQTMFGR